ncbi:MAG: DUF1476 domain-containing protein [Pseudomonadota bacterium]
MTTFNNREQAFEKKYALDEEQKFKAIARRNKLLGLWAAEQLGKTGAEADAYATEVVHADFEEAGDEDIIRKLTQDFAAAGKKLDTLEVNRQLETLMGVAVQQVKAA